MSHPQTAPLRTLIDPALLRSMLAGPAPCVVLDCGFDLFDPAAGQKAWEQGHLPGAIYAHLDRDLSGPKSSRGPVEGGRHPLPPLAVWAQRVAAWGITPQTFVVCYDDQGGPYAARAWWMLRWLGHEQVAVLDGGRSAWVAAGGPLESVGAPDAARHAGVDAGAAYPLLQESMRTVKATELAAGLGALTLVDARAAERYRGETEPLDTRAGHIPGALNRFFKDNLQPDGRFKAAEDLRKEWSAMLGEGSSAVHQCGSGVTACHNLLAVAHAGLGLGVLYPGSWSEWSADPSRPVAVGAG